MRKRGKTLSLLLAFSLALGSFAPAPFGFASLGQVQAAEQEDPVTPLSGTCREQAGTFGWDLVEDPDNTIFPEGEPDTQPVSYKLVITGTGELGGAGSMPWQSSCSSITSVTINEGITAIGDYSLAELCNVTSITLPDSVASIGAYAFQGDHSLKTVVCGSGLMKIGDHAFESLPSLAGVTLNEGLAEIGSFAFRNCEKISGITLPDSLTAIGESAFEGTSLTSIAISRNVAEIGHGAFRSSALQSVQLNEGLKTIGPWAFSHCSISAVTLPDSLASIGEYAFFGTPLTSVTIPRNVAEISHSPFPETPMENIQVDGGNQRFFTDSNILYEKEPGGSPKRAIAYAGNSTADTVKILEGTERIDDYAFYGARNLTSVTLPSSLATIGETAFSRSALRELDLPDSLATIGAYAFSNCNSLTEAAIPDNVGTLGAGAFLSCASLAAVSIGKKVPVLDAPFRGCMNIATVTVSPENPYLESLENVVYSKDHTQLFYYASAKQGSSYHVLNQVKKVHTGAIESASTLEKLYFPASLETIDSYGIFSNQNLAAIYFAGNCPKTDSTGTCIYRNAASLILLLMWDKEVKEV